MVSDWYDPTARSQGTELGRWFAYTPETDMQLGMSQSATQQICLVRMPGLGYVCFGRDDEAGRNDEAKPGS